MAGKKTDLIQGTLDLLILKTIAHGPIHGFAGAAGIAVSGASPAGAQRTPEVGMERIRQRADGQVLFADSSRPEIPAGRNGRVAALCRRGCSGVGIIARKADAFPLESSGE